MAHDPFHEGEIAVQERAGERDIGRRRHTIISPRIVPGALPFLAQQRLIALSVPGDDGQLWTSVWCGEPGFVGSDDGARLIVRRSLMTVAPDDPVLARLVVGRDIGVLAIELTTRRRLRVNGRIERVSPAEIVVRVRESVPNCPKYIQRREPHDAPAASRTTARTVSGRAIDDERRAFVERADTAFVGSLHPSRGVDASHRGGEPGFIRVVDPTTLRVPDYAGNSMFLTLGNFEIDPRASLAVVDFDRGRIVSVSGTARLRFTGEIAGHPTGGTGRYWELSVREWIEFDWPSAMRWERLDSSPFNPTCPHRS
ncbi:MAG TPA: pyridoxamine 5'-phosphate oxidase family protein [Vicinamibacterales bacterium]|nr:pyridoxamine 5'-phosphate oxidase family protein [Vicinamibacterales bacterium]